MAKALGIQRHGVDTQANAITVPLMHAQAEKPEIRTFSDPDVQQLFEILKAATRANSKRQKAVIFERLSTEAKQLSEELRKDLSA